MFLGLSPRYVLAMAAVAEMEEMTMSRWRTSRVLEDHRTTTVEAVEGLEPERQAVTSERKGKNPGKGEQTEAERRWFVSLLMLHLVDISGIYHQCGVPCGSARHDAGVERVENNPAFAAYWHVP